MQNIARFHQAGWTGYRLFRIRRLREASVLALSTFVPLLAVGLGSGMLLRYHRIGGWIVPLLGLAGLVLGGSLAFRFGRRHRLSYLQFLRHLERRLGLGENELVNAEEMEARAATFEDPLTRGLAELSVERGQAGLEGVSFRRLAPALDLRRPLLRGGAGLAVMAILAVISPVAFTHSAGRLLSPGTYDLPPALAIRVEPGNATVERGAPVRIRATLSRPRAEVRLLHRSPGGAWKGLEMTADSSAPAASPGKGETFGTTLAGVAEQTEYLVAAGSARSETYRLRVIEPLRATGYQKRVEFPEYTGLAPLQELGVEGNLSALVGSRATLTVVPSRPGARGRLLVPGAAPIPLEPRGENGLAATIPVRQPMEYRVELSSPEGPRSRWESEPFRLDAVADRLPTLAQLSPDRDITLPPEMAVQLEVDCLDDFGLTRLDLVYRRNDGDAQRVNLFRWQGVREARVPYPWDLQDIAAVPGDRIVYHLELTDNDAVSGPKTTVGPDCEIRFPSLDEMYAGIKDERQDQVVDLREAMQNQQELREDLRKIQDDMKQSRDMRWEQQEQLKDLATRQGKVSEQIEQLAQSLERSLDHMQQANLFTPDMLEKVQQINQMVKEIQSPQLQQYLKDLQQAIQRLDRQDVNRALENMQLTQKDIERSLDRAMEMLKQLKREEALDQLVQQGERLLEDQKRLNEQMETPKSQGEAGDSTSQGQQNKMSPQESANLQAKQQALQKELEKLQKALAELRQEAEQKWQELKQQMDQRQSDQQLTAASKSMQEASKSMGSCQKKDSLKFGRQAQEQLQQFAKGMKEAQDVLGGAEREALARKLYALSGQLVELSQEQEGLLGQAPGLSTRELAEEQIRLAEGAGKTLDELFDLAKKNRFITPELGRVMGEAVRQLRDAGQNFGQGDRPSGMQQASASTGSLDQTVLSLLAANEQSSNSSCSGSNPNPLARMRSLSGQQESLNQDMEQLMGQCPNGQRLSASGSQGEQLLQMAARQEMIRQGLQEVQQSMGERSDVLGRLGDMGKEMADVVQDMRTRDVDERILRRQERILSRLLTAQRSLRKEGQKEERISRTGVNPSDRVSPPPVAAGPTWRDVLRRGILRGSQDPVPGEYRRLVESYFRSLGEKQ